jgi:hypothetical protein
LLTAVALAGCGGGEKRIPENDELPNVGLGEAAPPSIDTSGWRTDFAKHTVPLAEFQTGGPGKDGIPAIDRPKLAPARTIRFLEAKEPVIELDLNGEARAYPIQILIWHEIVNDTVAGTPVAVTFCPLCNTAIAFDRRLGGRTLEFGTTGNLRNSDLVMYDRQTESWWQQFGGTAVVGELSGKRLHQLPARIVAWSDFLRAHPDAPVLTRDTGFTRSYGQNPYAGYDSVDSSPLFPVKSSDDKRLPPKERVVFVERGDDAVAIPFSTLAKRRELRVGIGGHELIVRWRPGVASPLDNIDVSDGRLVGAAEVREDGRLVAFDQPFWFAVAAFRPDARIVR